MSKATLIESKKSWGGLQNRYEHSSDTLKCLMNFSLYLPENNAKQPVSLVWFLSGLTCNDQNFATKAGFQRYANELNLAIAMPDTSPRGEDIPDIEEWDLGQGAGFYLNTTQEPWSEHFQMFDYLAEELMPLIHSLIPHYSGKQSVMGHSMGGYGALIFGLKLPDEFYSISAFAPISNPTQVPWGQKAFAHYLANKEEWSDWNPIQLLKNTTLKDISPILITQGEADTFYPEQLDEQALLASLEAGHYDYSYHKVEGYDHSYYMIASFVEEHLQFHAKHLVK